MRLDGIYTGPDVSVPEEIRATGTEREFEQLRPLKGNTPLARPLNAEQSDERFIIYPADKGVVRQIARKTEVQCDDQRLIDWMATP